MFVLLKSPNAPSTITNFDHVRFVASALMEPWSDCCISFVDYEGEDDPEALLDCVGAEGQIKSLARPVLIMGTTNARGINNTVAIR